MTPDTLRSYIADAEMAIAATSSTGWAKRRVEVGHQHERNATPELFAALCRLAVAAMEQRTTEDSFRSTDYEIWNVKANDAQNNYGSALRALETLP